MLFDEHISERYIRGHKVDNLGYNKLVKGNPAERIDFNRMNGELNARR